MAARGGDEDDEEEEEDDDYEFSGGVSLGMLKTGQKLSGVVMNIRDFGAFVDFGAESQGLVPRSKISDDFVENVEDHVSVGDMVDVWVSDIKGQKVTLSMTQNKIFGVRRGEEADISLFEDIKSDEWMSGNVVSVRAFGAFVQLQAPGSELTAQGLVHVSQMGETRVEDVGSIVSVGDEVKVRVIKVDTENKKLSLSMKQEGAGSGGKSDVSSFNNLSDDEWIDGKVVSIVNFGAFVEVATPAGGAPTQGLVHITQIKDGFVEDAGEEVEVDQDVKVRVVSVDEEKGKIALSMRPKAPAEATPVPEAEEA